VTQGIPRSGGGRGDCVRRRAALLELVEVPAGGALTPGDRAHLESCARCRAEITDLALTAAALRRSFAATRDAEPGEDAWPALRARLLRQRGAGSAGRAASPLAAVVLAAGLAVAMLLPYGLPLAGPQVIHEAGIDPAAIMAAGRREAEVEARQLRALVLAGKEASSTDGPNRARMELIRFEVLPVSAPRTPPRGPASASVQ